MAVLETDPGYLRAVVDMGSNGIRFSISSLQPPTQRVMPTLYQHRADISLYDAQYLPDGDGTRVPIDAKTISSVIASFKHFKETCQDFGVADTNVTVLATEATRTALNSDEFQSQIKDAVGWSVKLLTKEDEGTIGAMGVASSLSDAKGLMMDLGGGSTQLTWFIARDGNVELPPSGSVSMPYGAAALTRRLAEAEKTGKVADLKAEVSAALRSAYASLKVPTELEQETSGRGTGGMTLHLSGGGFRGWGYLLMNQHRVKPYPIPTINGFRASSSEFLSTSDVRDAASAALSDPSDKVFRISDRRAGQVPAVAFLIEALSDILPGRPGLASIRFCQGGVREGYLYRSLDPAIRAQHPLVVGTKPFAAAASSSRAFSSRLADAIPSNSTGEGHPHLLRDLDGCVLEAFANLADHFAGFPKDVRAAAALRCTTTGLLAGVHGVMHESRAVLALLLCARWGGTVPPGDEGFKAQLEELVGEPITLWWVNYLGAVARAIAVLYPGGRGFGLGEERLRFVSRWAQGEEGGSVLELGIRVRGEVGEDFLEAVRDVEKVGKKKRWIGGKGGSGYKVVATVSEG